MCQLIESIKIEGGNILRLPYHLKRMKNSLSELWDDTLDLSILEDINSGLKHLDKDITYKLRILYTNKEWELEFIPYSLRAVASVQLVYDDNISYAHKSADRMALDRLFNLRQDSDDILIVKNGLLTDSYYCNIALSRNDQWFTPSSPLLNGTMRDYLLDSGQIIPSDIPVGELSSYSSVRLFNAMIDFGSIELPIQNISN